MTREQAIYMLKGMRSVYDFYTRERFEALTMAIEALEQEPCEDCISRADAIDFFYNDDYVVNELKNLAPVNLAQKVGYWKFVHPLQEDDGGSYMCSICNVGDWNLNGKEKYCPNCGAKMQGVKEE